MGKCHRITFVRWIVKYLVSYMTAAQQDNRLISWLSEPYRTISLFLTLIPFSLDTRLRLVHTFSVHSVNTYPVDTHTKNTLFLHSEIIQWFFFSSTERTRNSQPIPDKNTVAKSLSGKFFPTYSNLNAVRHCQRRHNNRLLSRRYRWKDTTFFWNYCPQNIL